MIVYRIAKKKYIKDLSGEGARINGGRWNKKGTSLLYTSENRSLATVEYLVHIPLTIIPKDIFIAQIEIPKGSSIHTIQQYDLPNNWSVYPAPLVLSEIVVTILKENEVLALRVPSSIVKGEWNILLNPNHKEYSKITIADISEYSFDNRLINR